MSPLPSFRAPAVCRRCHRLATVRLQHTIRGTHVTMHWQCAACQAEWRVSRKDDVRILKEIFGRVPFLPRAS